jgi:hypothetical protein
MQMICFTNGILMGDKHTPLLETNASELIGIFQPIQFDLQWCMSHSSDQQEW